MNQITISIFNGVAANQTQFVDAEESLDFEELKKVVSRTSWSPFLFRDVTDFLTKKGKRVTGKYRESSCFLSTGLLVYDVDDGFTLKEGVEKCQNLSLRYLVATTRSHQKEKNGKPACDRYRVVLFLSRVITDANEYGAVWRHFAGAFGVDPSCKDLARFYFSCREIVAEGSGNPVDVDQILKNGGEPPPPEFDATNVNGGSGSGGRYGQLSRSTLDFIANGRKADESWHKRFFKAATDLREQGYPIEEARRRLIFAAKDELGCLDKEDEHLLQDVYARVNRYPPRGSEAARSSQDDGPAAFPKMDSAAFIGLPGEVVAAVEPHTEADPIAILIQLLNMIGNVVGRNRYYQVEGDRHFANLFTVLIGETARARKGTSYGRCIPILKTTDGEWFLDCVKSGLSSGEGLIHNVRDPGLRHTTKGGKQKVEHDPGVSDKRLFIQEGEFA